MIINTRPDEIGPDGGSGRSDLGAPRPAGAPLHTHTHTYTPTHSHTHTQLAGRAGARGGDAPGGGETRPCLEGGCPQPCLCSHPRERPELIETLTPVEGIVCVGGLEYKDLVATITLPTRGPVVVLGGVHFLIRTICKTRDNESYESQNTQAKAPYARGTPVEDRTASFNSSGLDKGYSNMRSHTARRLVLGSQA